MAIVLGYVPLPEGRAALARALDEVRLRGGPLIVVNSSRGDSLIDDRYLQGQPLEDLRAELTASGVDFQIRQNVRGRDAAEEIQEAVDDTRAELVVIGLRRRTPVGKMLMGSAAQQILLDVDCPILAVKARR